MNITIIGAGNMGSGFVKQLSAAGHKIRVTAQNLDKAQALAAAHAGVEALPAALALGDSQVVIVATPFGEAVNALKSLGSLEGRVVIDITNPLTADYMGLTLGFDTSAAEQIAAAVPGARVVKAFNTILAQVLAQGPVFGTSRAPVFYAADDDAAKAVVRELIAGIGFTPVDAGGLKNARYLEPVAGLNIYFAYGAGHGTQIAPNWIRRD
ncbi:NADPH-dependent F420 reductase [Uliginosibacterium aquaticum]|uniref:NAD(P)-binding domain-containing protein n=1 Tax=Uliginosibacterium aquaticum TaxID=2731212 RepID=A0ABX2IDD6_9RHOO|nr:NAD(P)-binding domain-containing protein [Uliginosibacterium aquaticum]NSL54604.1 NAD(P)-binding domain-containing protein [Uliginosibacterium aquaticum]